MQLHVVVMLRVQFWWLKLGETSRLLVSVSLEFDSTYLNSYLSCAKLSLKGELILEDLREWLANPPFTAASAST